MSCLQKIDVALPEARNEFSAVFSDLESLRCSVGNLKKELSIARADIAVQSSLREESLEQLDTKLVELKEVPSQSERRNEELAALNEQQSKFTVVLAMLRMQSANNTAEKTNTGSVLMESERPAKRAKIVRGSGSGVRVPYIAAYSALLAEHDKLKNRFEALTLKNQCLRGLAEEAKQLRAKVSNMGEANALLEATAVRGKRKKRSTVAEERLNALEEKLKAVQDGQKINIEAAEESEKRATNIAAQLAASFRRITEVEENSKTASAKVLKMQKQVAEYKKFTDVALRRLSQMSEPA